MKNNNNLTTIKVLEINAEDLFLNSDNYKYIVNESVFHHTEADEYMLYLNYDSYRSQKGIEKELKEHNCTQELIEVIQEARKKKAIWLMFYR